MREYSVKGENVTIASGSTLTLAIVNPGASRVIEIVRAWCSQNGSTTSGQLGVRLGLKASAFGTYTSSAPQKLKTSDPSSLIAGGTAGAAGTSGINASAEGAGTVTTVYPDSFNVLNGWLWTPNMTAGESLIVSGADSLAAVLQLTTSTASYLSGWDFGITFRELG